MRVFFIKRFKITDKLNKRLNEEATTTNGVVKDI